MGWLSAIPGVRIVRPGQDFTELDIDRERDPEVILRTALARGIRVTRYEIADPSLEEIFIEHVGRPVGEERHLAKPGSTAADGASDDAAGDAAPGTAPSHEAVG